MAAAAAAPLAVPCAGDNAANVAALRSAIAAADAAGSGTVTLAANCTYTLTGPDNQPNYTSANGLPIITGAVTIDGAGATIRRSNGAGVQAFRFVLVASGGSLVLDHLTLRGGSAGSGGAVLVLTDGSASLHASTLSGNRAGSGGAVSAGTRTHVTIDASTISDNVADASGGGLLTASDAVVRNATVSGNAAMDGGGIENAFGTISITDSTLSGNVATDGGGGLDTEFGSASLVASTLNGNRAGIGGAVFNTGSLLAANSTLEGNTADIGAGVANHHFRATVVNSTFAANTVSSSGSGGAVYNEGGDFRIANTIMAANAGGSCNNRLGTAVSDGGHNISFPLDDTTCSSSFGRGDPLLGPLENNGGPTDTMVPALGSAAIDAGDDAICAAAVDSGGAGGDDQRSVIRPQGRHCDIGAVEVAHEIRLLYDPSRAWSGAAMPIRLQLLDPQGANVSSPATVLSAVAIEMTTARTPGGCRFSEDAAEGGSYRCVLKTDGLPPGAGVLVFIASDGPSTYRAPFIVAGTN